MNSCAPGRNEHRAQREQLAGQRAQRLAEGARRSPVPAQREQLRARAQRDAALLDADPTLSAATVMLADDTEANLDRAGRRMDDWLAGKSEGATFGRGGI